MSGKRSMWFGGVMALAVLGVTLVVGGATVLAKRAMAEEQTIVVAQAASDYQLFKVISAKDEIIIGLSPAEAEALGRGPALDNLAQRLSDLGQITVWQFVSRKADVAFLEPAVVQSFEKNNPGVIRKVTLDAPIQYYANSIMVGIHDTELLSMFNMVLTEMHGSGYIERSIAPYGANFVPVARPYEAAR